MFRHVLLCVLIACLAAPLAAQTPQGWRMRVDRSTSAEDPDDRPDLKVASRGNGFQVTGGPAATLWNATHTASGNYTAKATFTLVKPSGHTNYYGLIFGGSGLEGAGQAYTYFLVAQDGTYIIRKRAGETVTDIQRSTPHAAVKRPDAAGRSTNTLEVRVAGNNVSYVVNDTVVHTSPKSAATTDGIVGVRVNHLLDVVVEDFQVNKTS
jgi:hypothetical protein